MIPMFSVIIMMLGFGFMFYTSVTQANEFEDSFKNGEQLECRCEHIIDTNVSNKNYKFVSDHSISNGSFVFSSENCKTKDKK